VSPKAQVGTRSWEELNQTKAVPKIQARAGIGEDSWEEGWSGGTGSGSWDGGSWDSWVASDSWGTEDGSSRGGKNWIEGTCDGKGNESWNGSWGVSSNAAGAVSTSDAGGGEWDQGDAGSCSGTFMAAGATVQEDLAMEGPSEWEATTSKVSAVPNWGTVTGSDASLSKLASPLKCKVGGKGVHDSGDKAPRVVPARNVKAASAVAALADALNPKVALPPPKPVPPRPRAPAPVPPRPKRPAAPDEAKLAVGPTAPEMGPFELAHMWGQQKFGL